MYKVGKVFMEESRIDINCANQRVVPCPRCGKEVLLDDDELVGDIILCEICNTPIKIIE